MVEKLKYGNKVFIEKFEENKKLYLDLVEKGQHPKVLWVGCSDSRVVPEFIVNAKAGDLFVTRNIANIIPPENANDACSGSVLEYAALHLEVEHIIICGHTGCGGITALVNGVTKDSIIEKWLGHAENAKVEHSVLETIKKNIILQASNLLTFSYVKERIEMGKLKIHKWLYAMESGKISYFDKISIGADSLLIVF